MSSHHRRTVCGRAVAALLSFAWFATPAMSQQQTNPSTLAYDLQDRSAAAMETTTESSTEQGQTMLEDTFELERRQWRLQKRAEALQATQFKLQLRTYYFSRDKFDNTRSEAMAIGGWAGFKTGYFLDHLAIGATAYTSQHLYGDDDTDGTQILATGQEGYTVLGELYADFRIMDDLNLYVGRKEFDTPYINRDDSRMTPKTFEGIVLQGRLKLGEGESVKYGAGYFSKIKERNSDEFVSMSEDAGAKVDRGVFAAGALYQ